MATAISSRSIRTWMWNHAAEYADPRTGEINSTHLAEACAHHFGADHWLDHDTHEVWELAVDVAEEWEANRDESI
jgi:hypothetical protein